MRNQLCKGTSEHFKAGGFFLPFFKLTDYYNGALRDLLGKAANNRFLSYECSRSTSVFRAMTRKVQASDQTASSCKFQITLCSASQLSTSYMAA